MGTVFPCTKCGGCCMEIGLRITRIRRYFTPDMLTPVERELAAFPFNFDEKGTCEKYDPEKGCTVYKTRPDCCNILKMYDRYFKPMKMTLHEFYLLTASDCNRLIDQLHLDKDKKVIIR
ncbi:YkgJ family cysteine cluster protein [Chitinophaga sp. CC14]|uniref:YkgJ family cysteine cluster protein n=1 Tax=Chitinophaga sp. CC14 TaxID=3029199 RepID=UPI003B7D4B9A